MNLDRLTISVLFGTGVQRPEIREVLDKLPQLKVVGQTANPQSFTSQLQGVIPDVVLVEMNGESQVPEWLANLPQEMPQTQVLVCSYNREPDFLIRAMQVGIREFLPLPLVKSDLEAALMRAAAVRKRVQPVDSDQQGRVIVVTGHKGGSGSTTIATNLALALAEGATSRLALVDLGRPFADIGTFLDHETSYSISDLVQNIATLDTAFIQRIMQPYGDKLVVLHGASDFRDQESIDVESLDKIFSMLRQMFRYTVVDLSHWLDEIFLKVLIDADMVIMLTGFTIPDLRNLKKLWPHIREWKQDRNKIKIVVNRYDNQSGLQLKDLEYILKHPAFFTLPSDYPGLMQCLNQGSLLSTTVPRSKLWRSIKEMASQIVMEIGTADGAGEGVAVAKKRFWLF